MSRMLLALSIPLFIACGVSIDKVGSDAELDSGTEDSQDSPNTGAVDADGDGLTSDEDCDDTDADVSPAVEFEICNDLKNNNCAWEEDNCGIGGYGYAVNHGTITAVSNVRIEAPSSAEYTNAQLGFWAGGIGDVDQDVRRRRGGCLRRRRRARTARS